VSTTHGGFRQHWREVIATFLKIGALSYGGAASTWGAAVAAAAVYLPSFILILSMLPVLERVKQLAWMKTALQGISPVVVGITAVAVLRMQPYAVPDLITSLLAVGTVVAMGLWHLSPLPLMAGGAAIGLVLRARLS
jgi:chromate transporter